MSLVTTTRCPNCEEELAGGYCHRCGQKAITPHHYQLGHFLKHALHELTHFDSKIFRSLLPLMFKPGALTAEYLAGRQARFIKPITLFILLNLFFFLVGYRLGLLHWNMIGVMWGPHGKLAESLVEEKIKASGQTREAFEKAFNEKLAQQQRSMFLIIIPFLALALKALYPFSRRYYVEHLIYATHFFAYLLLFLALALPALLLVLGLFDLMLGARLAHVLGRDPWIVAPIVCGILVYHLLALKRVYGQGWMMTSLKAAALSVCAVALVPYVCRPILFFMTYFAM